MASDLVAVENRLWATADQLWANIGLKPSEFLGKELVLQPPAAVQDQFAVVAGPMLQLAENQGIKNDVLRTTRGLLLPKLVSGELDVSAMPKPAKSWYWTGGRSSRPRRR